MSTLSLLLLGCIAALNVVAVLCLLMAERSLAKTQRLLKRWDSEGLPDKRAEA